MSGSGIGKMVLKQAYAGEVSKACCIQETVLPSIYKLLKYTGVKNWDKQRTIIADKDVLFDWIRTIIQREPFDEEWYLETYPDIWDAVKAGKIRSGRQHYIETGYFEGRLPGLFGFKVENYLELNPDLRHLSKEKALQHFLYSGYHENRGY